jgi:LysR family transcriptional regulator, glycine cleavage system transcriptional activator
MVSVMNDSRRIAAPLQVLPTFELVAEHLSIKRAAELLHLTPSAVSQQIRTLESALGLKLFDRLARALALTPAGVEFAAVVSATLDTLRSGTRSLQRQHVSHTLRLSTDPFVAHEILIPQLHTYNAARTGVDLRIETSTTLSNLRHDGIDIAIRYGRGPWPGLTSTLLCEMFASAVCAPGLVPRDRMKSPRALARHPLIRLRDQPDPWLRVGALLGIELTGERLIFDSYFAALRAAEAGLGVAFAVFPPTSAWVSDGRLVVPLPLRIRVRSTFQFVCRKEDSTRSDISGLREWAVARFRELPGLPETDRWPMLDEP